MDKLYVNKSLALNKLKEIPMKYNHWEQKNIVTEDNRLFTALSYIILMKYESLMINHENLKIVIFERTIDKEEQERFIKSNPNCDTYFKVDSNKVSTNPAWRNNPARKKLKEFLCYNEQYDMMWRYVTGFDEETGDYIIDYDSDQYKYK